MAKVIKFPVQEDVVGPDHFSDPETKEWLIVLLKETDVEITFIKRDGTERVMDCSLDPVFIPVVEKKTDRVRKENPEVLSVVDIEIGEWRSIRWDSITGLRWGFPTKPEEIA